jgi:hypothetical protein
MIKSKAIFYLKVIRFLDTYLLIFNTKVKFLFLLLITHNKLFFKNTFKDKPKSVNSAFNEQRQMFLSDLTRHNRTLLDQKSIKYGNKFLSLSKVLQDLFYLYAEKKENTFVIPWLWYKKIRVYKKSLNVL